MWPSCSPVRSATPTIVSKPCHTLFSPPTSFFFASLKAVLAARSLQVLVVSFGSLEGARIWLDQTGCTFNMVLDPQKKVEILVFNQINWLELGTFETTEFSLNTDKCNQVGRRNVFHVARMDFLCVGLLLRNDAHPLFNAEGCCRSTEALVSARPTPMWWGLTACCATRSTKLTAGTFPMCHHICWGTSTRYQCELSVGHPDVKDIWVRAEHPPRSSPVWSYACFPDGGRLFAGQRGKCPL